MCYTKGHADSSPARLAPVLPGEAAEPVDGGLRANHFVWLHSRQGGRGTESRRSKARAQYKHRMHLGRLRATAACCKAATQGCIGAADQPPGCCRRSSGAAMHGLIRHTCSTRLRARRAIHLNLLPAASTPAHTEER